MQTQNRNTNYVVMATAGYYVLHARPKGNKTLKEIVCDEILCKKINECIIKFLTEWESK